MQQKAIPEISLIWRIADPVATGSTSAQLQAAMRQKGLTVVVIVVVIVAAIAIVVPIVVSVSTIAPWPPLSQLPPCSEQVEQQISFQDHSLAGPSMVNLDITFAGVGTVLALGQHTRLLLRLFGIAFMCHAMIFAKCLQAGI